MGTPLIRLSLVFKTLVVWFCLVNACSAAKLSVTVNLHSVLKLHCDSPSQKGVLAMAGLRHTDSLVSLLRQDRRLLCCISSYSTKPFGYLVVAMFGINFLIRVFMRYGNILYPMVLVCHPKFIRHILDVFILSFLLNCL